MRDYEKEVVDRLRALEGGGVQVRVLAQVGGFPVLAARRARRDEAPVALLIGGTHGDEPAGVEAVFAFLEREAGPWLQGLSFEALVCTNPHGFAHGTRHNAQDADINWSYARADVPEVGVVKDFIRGRRFAFALDFHEDWESPGFYLYELRRGKEHLGPLIAERVSRLCPLNTSERIEGHPAAGGLVFPDTGREVRLRGEGIPLALYHEHTDHLLTAETPTELPMEVRLAAHQAVLETVVEAHLAGR